MVKFKDLSRPLSVFQVLFKADLIFKDFSRKPSKFKYFSSLCEPCLFVCFVALRPKSTAMVIAGWSVHLTTLFPGQA